MAKLSLITAFLCAVILGSANAFLNGSSPLRKSSSLHMTVLTAANGKKVDVKEGSSLKAACNKLGVKPKYSCQKWVGGTSVLYLVPWICEFVFVLFHSWSNQVFPLYLYIGATAGHAPFRSEARGSKLVSEKCLLCRNWKVFRRRDCLSNKQYCCNGDMTFFCLQRWILLVWNTIVWDG